MVYLAMLVGLLLALTAEARVGNSSESSFCTESKECLLYNLVCENEDYEVRHYEAVKWVSTDEESYFMEMATTTAFRRLFKYITGSNEDGIHIDMTAPVVVKIEEKKRMWQSSVFSLSFLLPSVHQTAPPKPTDEKVYFLNMPDMNVYVRSYGGWMMSLSSRIQSYLLSRKLKSVQATYNKDFHYAVGYDSPMKIMNRHNEVWYVVEGEPVCSEKPAPSS